MPGFRANGLLAPPAPSPTPDQTETRRENAQFQSNGLLGAPFEAELLDSSETVKVPNDQPVPSKEVPNSAKDLELGSQVSSGSASARISFTANGLLSESQDDDLPTLADLVGLAPRAATMANDIGSDVPGTSASVYLHRMPIRARTFEGKTVYLKRKTRVEAVRNTETTRTHGQRVGNLLDVPIHRLMNNLSATTAAKLATRDRIGPQPLQGATQIDDTLWVDRYRPNQFTELMGNERVARETMAWVKQWDWCVFGKKKGKKRAREGDQAAEVEDEFHRPHEKILLLSGPPGLGKTTLAHVVAHQAGYEVMEINASDARSGFVVDDRIRPALESGSAVGSSKPVLLIIDEIDGATGAGDNSTSFIQKLVHLIHDKPRKKPRFGQSHDPKAKRPILRPIICICNDINAASLAKLRPYAYQIRFTRPADIHTIRRLREVCEMEGLKADVRALTTLVGVARGDLRGCLNTLQFIKSKNEEVTEAVIRGATLGMKEADSSVVSILNSIFSPMSRKRVKELALGEEEEARYVQRLSREIEGAGRESNIAIGCFAHYATLRQYDANFSRYEKANEWLTTFDVLSGAMYTDGDFALSPYLSYMLVPFYPLFQERGGQRVERNQADWECLQKTRTNEEIYKSLARGLRSASNRTGGDYRHLINTPILQLEFAPFINRIISPPLRPVNSQVIRPEERKLLTRLVGIMASLELRFFQERAEDGQLSYRLDPPIDVFITYDGKRAADINVSRYAVRHLVAGEIEAQLLATQADAVEKGTTSKLDYFARNPTYKSSLADADGADSTPGATGEPPSKRARVDLRDIADKPPTDFFGRLITVPSVSTTKAAARKNVEKKYRVTYRFAEGNSAAVRKPVKMAAFL